MLKTIKTFKTDENGAVTVDWTVMTAAIVGLGIASYGVVSNGISALSSSIDGTLRTITIPGFVSTLVSFDDFANGFGDWLTLVEPYDDPVLNGMLGPFYDQSGDPVLFKSFSFLEGTEYAVMEFDLTTVGHWEANDDMRLFIGGELMDATALNHDNIFSSFDDQNDDTQVAYTFIERRSSDSAVADQRAAIADATVANGATTDRDAIRSNVDRETDYTVQVVIKNPGTRMDLAIGRDGRSPYPGEAWAIDNFQVEASKVDPQADPTS